MQELKNKQVIKFLLEDRYRFLRHLMFLLGFLILLYNHRFSSEYSGVYKYYSLFAVYIVFTLMFYLNMYFLVPYFFFRARYISYTLFLVVLVMAGLAFVKYVLYTFLGEHNIIAGLPKDNMISGYYEGIFVAIPFILLTTTVKLFQRWAKDNERISELKSLTLNMELNELKNQISPHFLFNMLNNVKALIRNNPEKASAVIIKLSEFLRYQLYENTEEKTPLVSEMAFLKNFLHLEKIRRDNLSVSIDSQTDERTLRKVFVPPNLFTVFVENAVKHSTDITGKDTHIRISMEIVDKRLDFICSNSKVPYDPASNEKNSGLGLANIKRRLELLYPGKHRLDIRSKENEYIVNLIIPV